MHVVAARILRTLLLALSEIYSEETSNQEVMGQRETSFVATAKEKPTCRRPPFWPSQHVREGTMTRLTDVVTHSIYNKTTKKTAVNTPPMAAIRGHTEPYSPTIHGAAIEEEHISPLLSMCPEQQSGV